MPTLSLAIDARKAKEGAAEFRRAAKDAADAAGDAAKRTKDLEKAVDGTTVAERRSSVEVARARDERGRFVTAQARATEEVIRARDELGRFITVQERATRESEKFRNRPVRPTPTTIPGQPFPDGGRGSDALGSLQAFGSQLGPLGSQAAAFTAQAQGAAQAIEGIGAASGLSSAALLGLGGAVAGGTAILTAAISKSLEYEKSLRSLSSLLNSTAELEERRRAISSESFRTGFSSEELVRSEETVTRLFRNQREAIDLVRDSATRYARATNSDLPSATLALASTLDSFKLTASEADVVQARLFNDARNGSQEFIPFARALSSLGDEARAAGVNFGQLSVALSRAASEGDLGEATGAVRRFLIALNDESDPVTAKLIRLGAEFKRLPDGSRDLAQAFGEVQRVTGGSADVLAGIVGNRDFPAIFASITSNLNDVKNAAKVTTAEIAASNAALERNQSGAAAAVDRAKNVYTESLRAYGDSFLTGEALIPFKGIIDGFVSAGRAVDSLGSKIETAAEQARTIPTVVTNLQGPPVAAQDSPARREAQRAYQAFTEEILRQKPIGFPIDVAIQTQPDEVRRAFEAVTRAAGADALAEDVAKAEGQIGVLVDATKRLESAGKSRSDSLSNETEKVSAGRSAVDLYVRAMESEKDALGLTARELAALKAQRDAEKIASAAGLTLKDSEIKKLRDLAQANFDAAEAAKKRTDGEARASAAQAGYKEYVDALKEEVRLLQLSPEERVIDEQVRKAQTLADAYREARRAAGDDPRTVENLVPDQSFTIDQVKELILRIQDLKRLQEESPVDKFGPFIPEPQQQGPFGPEFDANAAEGQRRLEELQASLTQERGLLGLSNDERERELFTREAVNAAIQAGVQDRAALVEQMSREFQEFQRLRDLDQLGKDFGRTLASGFEDAIYQAKSFNDAVRDIGRELSQLAFRQFVTKPLTDSLGGLFSGLFTGGAGAGGTGGGIFARGDVFEDGNPMRFAHGGAFYRGAVVPFASGGIFDQPTYFPMSGGRTGLLGEAGPEAIMPLTRGPDGKLGVRSDGIAQAAPVQNNTTHVSMTVVTKDADSFRRSAAQITRDLKKRL